MKKTFEAIWEHGQIVPTESIQINDHTRLLVMILDEQKSDNASFIQEARRQSLLVSKQDHSEDEIWEANIDGSEEYDL